MIRTIIVVAIILVTILTILLIFTGMGTKKWSFDSRCSRDSDCFEGLSCSRGKCRKKEGYPCLEDEDCVNACSNNVCVSDPIPAEKSDSITESSPEIRKKDLILNGKKLTFGLRSDLDAPGIYILYGKDWFRIAKGNWKDVETDGESIIGVRANLAKRVLMRA